MAENKLSEELRHCLEDDTCGYCQYHKPETKLICKGLLQKACEVVKRYEEMEDRNRKLLDEITKDCCCELRQQTNYKEGDRMNRLTHGTQFFDDSNKQRYYNKLKIYEDLEEQGWLLRLPCKLGDAIYWIDEEEGEVKMSSVTGIAIGMDGFYVTCEKYHEDYCKVGSEFALLTRQEAEDKLAEMEGKK